MSDIDRVEELLGEVSPGDLPKILRAAVDQALLLDEDGVVLESLIGSDPVQGIDAWIGRHWHETVTENTRPKLERLLQESAESGVSRFRQVNHPTPDGDDVPVGYTLVRMGSGGHMLAIGRNLRSLAALQRQLVESQQSMESEYWNVRQAEARYRLLFQQSTEPVFLLDSETLKVSDANNAAASLLDTEVRKLVGKTFPPALLHAGPTFDQTADESFVDSLRQLATGAIDRTAVAARINGEDHTWRISASVVRFDGSRTILVRVTSEGAGSAVGHRPGLDVLELLNDAPEGFVVTDPDGIVLYANSAFLNMTQVESEQAVIGRSLSLWLGRPGADLTVLLTSLRERGQIRMFPTAVQGEHGIDTPVEVSGVAALDAEEPCLGITLRDVTRQLAREEGGVHDLNTAVEQLSEKVGEVSLKQLVDDTVGLVELHFIDAALQLTGDNRTAAAELLGLSRQSLYTKLKRYNLDSTDTD